MKLTKIYTKTGDEGETSLVGGIRIAKNAPRIEAYGTVDELSSHLGLLVAMLSKDAEHGEEYKPIIETLERIQNNLFSISSILATDVEALSQNKAEWVKPYIESLEAFSEQLGSTETPLLEKLTDEYNAQLPVLNSFILPGGSMTAAQCHVCRAVCRRAERRIVNVNGNGNDTLRYDTAQAPTIRPAGYDNGKGDGNVNGTSNLKQYMNRLSDYLFVLARKINIINGKEEKTWQNTCK
jgi:cob(I)alamin adenosyltransferase